MSISPIQHSAHRAPAPFQDAVHGALARHEGVDGALLPILHDIQHTLGYIPADVVPVLAKALQRSRAEIQGVISFYPDFRSSPATGRRLRVCRSEACLAMGSDALFEHAQTWVDGTGPELSLESVYCLGLCAQSPAIELDGRSYCRVSAKELDRLLAQES